MAAVTDYEDITVEMDAWSLELGSPSATNLSKSASPSQQKERDKLEPHHWNGYHTAVTPDWTLFKHFYFLEWRESVQDWLSDIHNSDS